MKPRYWHIIPSTLFLLILSLRQALAGDFLFTPAPAPTLDEWGLIGLAALLGTVGLFVLFKRK
jgi:uncharacterized membrane protein